LAQAKEAYELAKKRETAPRTKIFRLVHRDPEEVQVELQSLMGLPDDGPPGEMPGPGPSAGAGDSRPGGFRGMRPSFPGGGFGRPGSTITIPGWRVAVDKRTRSLIVRGSEKELQVAADLIAVLDAPAGKPMPKLKNVRSFKPKHASVEELAQV